METSTMKNSLALALALSLSAPFAVMAQNGQLAFTQEHFHHLDVDKDGKVTQAEYRQFMEGAFSKLDTDGNGQLSSAEAGEVLSAEQFASVDADGNGQLSRQEFLDQAMRDFQRADNNADGSLRFP